ncbi:MAG: amidase family protein, partial [Chloroflexota bacterium]
PATPAPAPRGRSSTGDPAFQTPWSYCGFPSVSLPTGTTESGLPLGVQLVAARWRDRRLLRVARWCEAALDFRSRPPCWSAAYG